jgi:multiple sugar transport system substrate-binding protein
VKDLPRRKFLLAGAATAGAGLLAACGATPTPQVIEKVVEKEVTKIVEGTPQVVVETVMVEQTVVVKETVVVEETVASEGPVFITYASYYTSPPFNQTDDEAIAKFEEMNPNVAVKKIIFPGVDFHDKLRLLATAGDLPDVWNLETKQLVDMVSRNMCLDITDMFASEAKLTKDDYLPGEWDKMFFQGKQYSFSTDTSSVILFYNKDIFDAKGVPYPTRSWDDPDWTYDKMLEMALQLTEGEGTSRVWGYDTSRWWVYCYPFVWSYGGKLTNDARTESAMTMPETIDAFQFRADLITKHRVQATPAEATEGTDSIFGSGRLAMRAVWGVWMRYINEIPNLHFDIAAMPRGAAGSFSRSPSDGDVLASTTKYPKESFDFAWFMGGPEGQELFCNQYGVGTPTLWEVAQHDSFIHPPVAGLENIDQTVILDGWSGSHFLKQDVTTKWPEMDKMISAAMDSLLDAKVTADEFCKTLDPQITELLQSIPEEQRGFVGD